MSRRKRREIYSGVVTTRRDGCQFNVLMECDDELLAKFILSGSHLSKVFDRAKAHATAESKRLGRGIVINVASIGNGD